jgi:DNA-binding GntR family transcriptional regulator
MNLASKPANGGQKGRLRPKLESVAMPRSEPPTRDGQNILLVHERLREAILHCELRPGEIKSQTALSQELGVGRTVTRAALRLLHMEGLVVGEPNKRVEISELTAEDAEDLYVVRITLEVAAVRLTVPTMTFDDVGELEGHLAHMDHYGRGSDWAGLVGPHRAFHTKFIAGGGPRVVKLISDHFDYAERYRLAYIAPSKAEWAQRQVEHRALIDAAAEGEAERTARLLTAHYAGTAARVSKALSPGYQLDRLRKTIEDLLPGCDEALAWLGEAESA